MTAPREEWSLDTRHVGRRVQVYDAVGSTNDVAAALASDPANGGVVVLADAQTAGRGQYGRRWLTTPGTSVLMSVLIFPPEPLRRPALLTAWAAVAVGEAVLESTGLQAKIKWPNDVLLHGRKVCGILIEQGRGTVVGIGLNVNQQPADFESAGLPDATSLAAATGAWFDTREVARRLITHLDAGYDLLLRGEVGTLEACWKRRVGLLGRHVAAELHDGSTVGGRLREMSFDGIELDQGGGAVRVVPPEAVRHLG
ncbi:MAG TPA: biotin--[acetyl-CoA-carboxylase] ligase [Gemmataceae bacterium]